MTTFLIFTPTHLRTTPFLPACARSVARAAEGCVSPVRWIVLANDVQWGCADQVDYAHQVFVRELGWRAESGSRCQASIGAHGPAGIGKLKRAAVKMGTDLWPECIPEDTWLVELDADDELAPSTLAVLENFIGACATKPAMIYADCLQFRDDGGVLDPYRADHGWGYSRFQSLGNANPHHGRAIVNHQFPVSPCSLSSILFSPDHLRVYNAKSYLEVGGHDPKLQACDDHDLTQRIALAYGLDAIRQVGGTLYLYRHHPGQRTKYQGVEDIQATSRRLWSERAEALTMRWAKDHRLQCIELGHPDLRPGYDRSLDRRATRCSDIVDLAHDPFPMEDDSTGWIRASHVLEHLARPLEAMAECWRVLAHGGLLSIEVPSALGWGAFADPTHSSFWVEQSFAYYTDPDMAQFVSGSRSGFYPYFDEAWARFQLVSLEHATLATACKIGSSITPVIRAILAADKGGERLPGLNLWR